MTNIDARFGALATLFHFLEQLAALALCAQPDLDRFALGVRLATIAQDARNAPRSTIELYARTSRCQRRTWFAGYSFVVEQQPKPCFAPLDREF